MVSIFVLKLIISFIIGFVWITGLSVLAERLGTRIGGAVAGIPATMVISLFFIGLTQSVEAAVEATTPVPLVVGSNLLFIIGYIVLSGLGLFLSLTLALLGWSLIALAITFLPVGFGQALIGFIGLFAMAYFILEKVMTIKVAAGKQIRYSFQELLLRGFIGGGVIVLAVWGAHVGGPLLGGVLASFPALTVALIIIAHSRNGADFAAHLLKHFALAGVVNVLVFVLLFRYLASFGLVVSTLLAFILSVANAYGLYGILNKRLA